MTLGKWSNREKHKIFIEIIDYQEHQHQASVDNVLQVTKNSKRRRRRIFLFFLSTKNNVKWKNSLVNVNSDACLNNEIECFPSQLVLVLTSLFTIVIIIVIIIIVRHFHYFYWLQNIFIERKKIFSYFFLSSTSRLTFIIISHL
jgi:hypothetical protein